NTRSQRPHGFGDSEIDYLRQYPSVVIGDKNIRRLNIAMENTLTVRVLDRFTDLDEEFHALPDAQFALVAKLRNRAPDHQLHSEVRQTGRRFAGVEYPSDIRVIHHGQCLPLNE